MRLAELIIKSTNLYFTIKLIPAIITPADEGRRFCRACGGDSLAIRIMSRDAPVFPLDPDDFRFDVNFNEAVHQPTSIAFVDIARKITELV